MYCSERLDLAVLVAMMMQMISKVYLSRLIVVTRRAAKDRILKNMSMRASERPTALFCFQVKDAEEYCILS
jgi:hypothetical protein